MKKIIQILIFSLLAVSCSDNKEELNISSVNALEEVDFSNENNVLLDVRTPEEFAEGHIPGSINIDYNSEDFEEQIAKLDKSKNYYVYCRSGNRSAKASKALEEQGCVNINNLKDGFSKYDGKTE